MQNLGYQATWYQIPEVQVELKMAVYYEENEITETNKRKLFLLHLMLNIKIVIIINQREPVQSKLELSQFRNHFHWKIQ